jgi:hypothetical protein
MAVQSAVKCFSDWSWHCLDLLRYKAVGEKKLRENHCHVQQGCKYYLLICKWKYDVVLQIIPVAIVAMEVITE